LHSNKRCVGEEKKNHKKFKKRTPSRRKNGPRWSREEDAKEFLNAFKKGLGTGRESSRPPEGRWKTKVDTSETCQGTTANLNVERLPVKSAPSENMSEKKIHKTV